MQQQRWHQRQEILIVESVIDQRREQTVKLTSSDSLVNAVGRSDVVKVGSLVNASGEGSGSKGNDEGRGAHIDRVVLFVGVGV